MASRVFQKHNEKTGGELPANRLPRRLFAAFALLPCIASAEYKFNFPEPVTPIARETLHIHNEFMLIITILFVVVFAIMIYSMIRHRKSVGHQPAKFTGPTGKLQWFWALVPFAILLFIDFILMGIPATRESVGPDTSELSSYRRVSGTAAVPAFLSRESPPSSSKRMGPSGMGSGWLRASRRSTTPARSPSG